MENQANAITINKNISTLKESSKYVHPLNKSLRIFFKEAVRVSVKNPSQAVYFLQTVRNQQKASHTRAKYKREGLHIPPIMIFSITNRCNLHCKGCYHQVMRQSGREEMSEEKLRSVIGEARDLGVSFVVLAGGEPLSRKEILDITRGYPDIIFFMFTNGLLITDETVTRFKTQKNLVPIISLEGYKEETDSRRGNGIFEHLQEVIQKIKKQDVFFGVSLTVTRSNFNTITDESFVRHVTEFGGKLMLFVEYSPIKEGTEDWVITDEQRDRLAALLHTYRARHSSLFVNVPGDEKDFGGCLSAGRGFIHVSAEGDVEPCPFAPYSDTNLRDKSLKEALQSKFLKAIRENDDQLGETNGSCALWAKREWVRSLLAQAK